MSANEQLQGYLQGGKADNIVFRSHGTGSTLELIRLYLVCRKQMNQTFKNITLIFTVLVFIGNGCFGQSVLLQGSKIQKDTAFQTGSFFNYFTGKIDSAFYSCGGVPLFDFYHLLNAEEEPYTVEINGGMSIYFDNHLMMQYNVKGGFVEGAGHVYYPYSGRVALSGNFEKFKLHGLVILYSMDGQVIWVKRYRRGRFVRLEYRFDILTIKGLKRYSKKIKGKAPCY